MNVRSGHKLLAMNTKEYAWMRTEYTMGMTAVDGVSDVEAHLGEKGREAVRVKKRQYNVARVRLLHRMRLLYRLECSLPKNAYGSDTCPIC